MNELSSHTLRVQVESQPFLDDPDGAELFYAAVGRAIRLFGRFEMHFVAAIRAIQQLPEFVHELPQEPTFPPATLRQQMRLWRKCFHSIERLSPLRSAALALIPAIQDASEDRAAIVHSTWNGFVSADPPTIIAIRHRHRNGKVLVHRNEITLRQVEEFCQSCDFLNTRLLAVSFEVISQYWR